ncbi:six-hairpin glycosidase-like protein [Spongiimicrobium salis]|uniref:six-hairpin glycosidase-like protein n=1 Tax=Spongiimicrobium salis TaxID=1667022 RepID=UPI00374CAF4D
MSRFYTYRILFFLVTMGPLGQLLAQENRWHIASKTAISWDISEKKNLPHTDNIEMSGKRVAAIVHYAVDSLGTLAVEREVFFPQLHPYIKESDPNWFIYRAYFKKKFSDDILPKAFIAGKQFVPGPLKKTTINGVLHFEHAPSTSGIVLERKLLPSPSKRLFLEEHTLRNTSSADINITGTNQLVKHEDRGADGTYTMIVHTDLPESTVLRSGHSMTYTIKIMAHAEKEGLPQQNSQEIQAERNAFLEQMSSALILETPNPVLNTLFEFSKIRASESIFESKLGLIHSPGGGRYYVGIWANDQAEYVGPFFPYLGYHEGNLSALNAYRAFAKEINPEYQNIRYAFEIEGLVPPFSLDRGDAAMIAYGASQYALALGDSKIAQELWPLISWCLEYCKRQLNTAGVVQSASDEMEGRIATGNANLSTSALYYGALRHAADLSKSLKLPPQISRSYTSEANALAKAIEDYFGSTVEGLETYRYYEGHQHLRHWICLPLVVGLHDRKEATVTALFDRLWTENGVHVEKNSENEAISKIFWDRGTLYALRGTFLSGATDTSLEKLIQFSEARLLGEHVPYVVEAFPEGNMAHLSAESGLYCRVFIEGLFGIHPTGFNSFDCIPRLPNGWDEMALRNIKAFGKVFDLEVQRKGKKTQIKVIDSKTKQILGRKTTALKQAVSFQF